MAKRTKSEQGKASKSKGKRGELEFSKVLTAHGFPARRGQQFQGSPDSPDIVCESLKDFHFEVKRTETLSLYKALEQAAEDAGGLQIPVVAHRRSNKPWIITINAGDLLSLLRRLKYGKED